MSVLHDLQKLLRENLRDYGMFIALGIIFVFFTIKTPNQSFLSGRNLVNLVNQAGYIAVLAVGMTLVIVIRHIDLSVGFLAGFLGALAAIAMVQWELPVYIVIPLILFFGILAGLLTSFLVATLGIPAFVATLAGWLGYRGALQLATRSTGTIVIPNETFNAMGSGFVPDFITVSFLPERHKVTLLLGLIGIFLYVFNAIRSRRRSGRAQVDDLSTPLFVARLALISLLIGGMAWILSGYQGLSWTAVIVLIVVIIYDFVTRRTVLGRHIYAVGGNPEAAELSGISVTRVTQVVFASMGMLAALSGMLYAARLRSATTTAGNLFELDAIAAAFVGGVSAAGGVGSVVGSIVGALVMISLTNGMNLMGADISLQYIVRALVLAGAVIFDVATRRTSQ
ncbi:MAG: sugar ABC transporter permease [Chloroflexota bacterium]|jgi:putative multiple sugar transport system permease protein